MFFNMLKRLAVYFLAFAVIFGVTLQIAGSALAGAGRHAMSPAMEMATMDMGSDCDQLAPPCKGAMPDCIDGMGCLINAAALVAPLAASVPFQWVAISYFSINAVPVGVSIKPEHSPPIPQA